MAKGQGRSSGQGVKLLYIRDYLYTHTDKDHPKNSKQISDYLAGKCSEIPDNTAAKEIAKTMIHRAAKIAAVLTAGPIVRSCAPEQTCTMVIEGSQYRKLTSFGDLFRQELSKLLMPSRIAFAIKEVENSCLIGAAIAAFAEPM